MSTSDGLVSEAPPRHLSIRLFRPYERDAKHEDQLTRAAVIVKLLSAFDGRLRESSLHAAQLAR